MRARDDFLGDWHISRRITDRFADQLGTLEGVAVLRAEGAKGLIYEETGTLLLGTAAPMQANRSYLWTFGPDAVAVRFANGDPFHDFAPDGQSQGSDHLCGADMYKVSYDFRDWPAWTATWSVAGPAKDYTMRTRYARP
jgi:hypothetical protein